VIVRRAFEFEAAHRLPEHPGKCRRLHGHSYRLVVAVEGRIDAATGMVIDFADLKRVVESRVIDRLDHACANDLMDNPTAEVLAGWIWNELRGELPGLCEVELFETRNCSVRYRGEG
jgi:6-pyruvoyltetrahydropterin/6-carboxytetrahydropterin synthase